MPAAVVNKVAEYLGKEEAERRWKKAQELASKNYPNVEKKSSNWYAIVMGIYKKMVKYKKKNEDFYLFVRSIHEEYSYPLLG